MKALCFHGAHFLSNFIAVKKKKYEMLFPNFASFRRHRPIFAHIIYTVSLELPMNTTMDNIACKTVMLYLLARWKCT